jgi:tryptophan-rich sensory protein
MQTTKDWIVSLGCILLCEGAGIVGSVFTTPAIAGWYSALIKPSVAPPNWIFGPVWTTLFLLMGIALFLVWKARSKGDPRILFGVFGVQLVLNVLWSFIFFGLHNPGAAFVEILCLWLAIAATIGVFAKVSKPAALLLVPYIAWVSFAGYLNYLIWILNA